MNRPTVLCVDDESVILRSLKDQLRRHFGADIRLETAEGGEEGLEVFDELRAEGREVPLVISDQLMPGMKGEEFLAAIFERDPRVLNILLTGQASVDAVGAAVNRARLYRYIAKPWDETDLVLTVREARRAWDQARELERGRQELELAHVAALRFVPKQILALLGRERVADVSFGDHVRREVHLVMSDMRGFTTLVEGLEPAEAFSFINEYIQVMERPLVEHGGFVVSTHGDEILALFPQDPDAAVAAGVASWRVLDRWNAEREARGLPSVAMGLGVHTGELFVGTIGGEERLQCDIVGDPVNVCSRIEGASKQYGARMLVSRHTMDRLAAPERWRTRAVDRVLLKGLESDVVLHEVLDALPEDVAVERFQNDGLLQQARAALTAGELETASRRLAAVLERDPGDSVAIALRRRCGMFQRDGLPERWGGITALSTK